MAKYDNNERRRVRKPQIMADAAYLILCANSREFTGNFCIDDEVLRSAGQTDLSRLPSRRHPRRRSAAGFFCLSAANAS